MKSKAPLVMMEQIVMVLIFALAAALCLQTFVLSGTISKQTEAGSRAAAEAQNAVEQMKAFGPESYLKEKEAQPVEGGFRVLFDEDWNVVKAMDLAAFYLEIGPIVSESEYLWKTEVIVAEASGAELIHIPAAGQTGVTKHE